MTSLFQGRWVEALGFLSAAEERLGDYAAGVAYEMDMARMFRFYALFQTGQWAHLFQELPGLLDDAARRGDHFANTNLRLRYGWLSALAHDRSDVARFELERATEGWSKTFTTQHYLEAKARAEIALYEREGAAHEACENAWAALKRSRLARVQYLRIDALDLRGRASIAKALSSPRGDELDLAERYADAIEKEETYWGSPLADQLRASIASMRGDRDAALRRLDAAATGLERAGMHLRAAMARRRQGELAGGDEGRGAVEAADDVLASERIRSPGKMAFLLAPGQWS